MRFILNPISLLISKITDFRIYLYKVGTFKSVKVNTKVISIGNLKVGGTGKTPFTIFLANLLIEKGFKVGIIGKGYKRKSKGMILYDSSKELTLSAEEIGDEMLLIAQKTNCPVLVHVEKYLAAMEIEKHYNLDFILVDDGYQHLQLKRDLNILMVDNETIAKGKVFPLGRLREKIENFDRADIICKIDYEQNFDFINKISIKAEKISGDIYYLDNSLIPIDKSSLVNPIAVTGLANPNGFYNSLDFLKIKYLSKIEFPDHFDYSRSEIEKLINKVKLQKSKFIITTEKDAIKLLNHLSIFNQNEIKIVVLPIDIKIISGMDVLLNKIKSI